MLISEHFYIKFQILCLYSRQRVPNIVSDPDLQFYIENVFFYQIFFSPNGILDLHLPIGHNHTF